MHTEQPSTLKTDLRSAHDTTQFEKLFDKTRDVSHSRVVRFQVFLYLEKPKRKKFEVELWNVFYLAKTVPNRI